MNDRLVGICCVFLGLASLGIERGWQLSVAGAAVLIMGLLFLVFGAS